MIFEALLALVAGVSSFMIGIPSLMAYGSSSDGEPPTEEEPHADSEPNLPHYLDDPGPSSRKRPSKPRPQTDSDSDEPAGPRGRSKVRREMHTPRVPAGVPSYLAAVEARNAGSPPASSIDQATSTSSGITPDAARLASLEGAYRQLQEENAVLQAQLMSANEALRVRQNIIGETLAVPNDCENSEAKLLMHVPPAFVGKADAQRNARIASKPRYFSGREAKGSLTLREWIASVQRYVFAVCWKRGQLVDTAVHFLEGDALQWWLQRAKLLARLGKDPAEWCVFLDALCDRWAFKNQELAARTQLHYLKQGNKPIFEHLRQFEALHAHIPTYDIGSDSVDHELSKIHHFHLSCNKEWQEKIAVNPSTNRRWTSFQDLANFVVAFVSDCNPDLIHDTVAPARTVHPGGGDRRSMKNRSSSRSKSRDRQAGGGAGPSRPRPSANEGAGPSRSAGGSRERTFTNSKGETFTRSNAVVEWIIGRGRARGDFKATCVGCYKPGHTAKQCTSTPKAELPQGFKAAE